MIKNPYVNAFLAGGYIVVLVLVANEAGKYLVNVKDTILDPMVALSTLVFSVALMGVLFFYEPAKLFLDGKREGALSFFIKTAGTFAVFVAVLVILLFSTAVLK